MVPIAIFMYLSVQGSMADCFGIDLVGRDSALASLSGSLAQLLCRPFSLPTFAVGMRCSDANSLGREDDAPCASWAVTTVSVVDWRDILAQIHV